MATGTSPGKNLKGKDFSEAKQRLFPINFPSVFEK